MNVALLGCGLIGGSVGLGLKAADPSMRIVAYDRDQGTAARAVSRGAADEAAASPAEAVHDADLVFVATPVRAIVETVAAVTDHIKPGCVLTDVGSTKSRVVVEVEHLVPAEVHFIGGHPMAGSEDEGIDAASPALFQGAWWILTPTERSDAEAYQRLTGIIATLGARIMALHPAEHDELMAVVSHIPQLTATALMTMAADRGRDHGGLLALAAGGFRDVTRVAASNPDIWVDICRENARAITEALGRFTDQLLDLRDLVERGDDAELRRVFAGARAARRGLPDKLVGGDLYEVRFPVPDRPGVLSEVTTAVGNLGINIEDLRIDHVTEGGRGTLHLTILGAGDADRVAALLQDRGYEARVAEA